MKGISALLLALGVASVANGKSQTNPVMRVVGLLKDLGEKLEKDAEAEETLYEKFKCWGTSTVTDKTKSNTAATERINYLKNYIAEMDAASARFKTEKEDLENEIKRVEDTLKEQADQRAADVKAFETHVKETTEGIDGVDAAIGALSEESKSNALLALRGMTAIGRMKHGEALKTGLELGQKYLSKADYAFLQDVMYGRVRSHKDKPKTGITGAYKSRLGGVIKTLEDIEINMKKDLKEDTQKDENDEKRYQKRKTAKDEEKTSLQAQIAKLEKENAGREKAKAESEAEIEKLEKQIEADDKIIADTKKELDEKEKMFNERLEYRTGEQEAISKAVEILHSDEARDLFAKAKPSFLQVSEVSEMAVQRMKMASKAISKGANTDHRMMILAAQLTRVVRQQDLTMENPTFDAVLGKIDEMKKAIKDEETADLKKKDSCEKNFDDDTAKAQGLTNKLADLKSAQEYLTAKLKEIADDTAAKNAAIAEVVATLASAKKVRDDENAEFKQGKADDEAAIELLQKAAKAVTDFYKEANSFLQIKATMKSDDVDKPEIFETEYKGAGAQSTGVVQTMKMVEDDIKKDIAVAEKEEKEASDLYDETKKGLEGNKKALEDDVDTLNVKKGERTKELQTANTDTSDTNDLMAALKKKMADVKPECDFYLNNYESRRQNRLTELNGLDKAKAILNGASFADEPGKGDSLLMVDIQAHKHREI
eukprot:TRINITY_DN728_c0_g1_i1.p1 TRINITY_DN728_c0_g1~~TRINITY_DN728_c0_g1_i1.p1  ORF type:complete len:713 (+),score=270.93 TRINITY_DN728_c0_g1_i1:91-2229(+)